jgi:hypothetical protein
MVRHGLQSSHGVSWPGCGRLQLNGITGFPQCGQRPNRRRLLAAGKNNPLPLNQC